jgi:NAD(P)-dependent dehydrogenase (short-subunit alcohol dehydrogenase family)
VAVSGAASGIGRAVRDRLERSGLHVVGVDLHDAEIEADLATAEGRRHAVRAVTEWSSGALDGAVACAGLGPHVRPVEDIARVNYFGALFFLDGLLGLLAAGEAAAAVAISSNGATLTPAHAGLVDALLAGDEEPACSLAATLGGATVYGMSKLALTRALRRRVGAWAEAGVRLNAVAPGPVDTPLLAASLADATVGPMVEALPVPVGRRATAAEIAAAVGFLLDPAQGFVHGSVLFVDGGSDALLQPDRF